MGVGGCGCGRVGGCGCVCGCVCVCERIRLWTSIRLNGAVSTAQILVAIMYARVLLPNIIALVTL